MSRILLGDSRDVLKTFDDESVDLCITSPPYKTSDSFSNEMISDVFRQVYRVQKNNSLFFLNFGHLAEDKLRPFKVCEVAMNHGYKLNDTLIWVKNHYKPIQGSKRLNNLTEFIFILHKGKMPKLDRLAIGIPYVDKSNAKRFSGGRDLKCAGNVWYIDYPTITRSDQKSHKDRYPVELPLRCIKLCGYPVKTILDPFCGSATTGVAAREMKKEFWGIEKDETEYQNAVERLKTSNPELLQQRKDLLPALSLLD
jgi:site-specific DNA-methyltransferase (adenine-specific)